MSQEIATAIEGSQTIIAVWTLAAFVGLGPTLLLTPKEWEGYGLLLIPGVGWSVLVLELFAVNLVVGVQVGIYLVLVGALLMNAAVLATRRRRPRWRDWREESLLPLLLAFVLMGVALVPHVAQRSLSLLSLNQDEEIYFPTAGYVMVYPSIGDWSSLSSFVHHYEPWGWGFEYTMAAASSLTGSPTFQVYLPAAYAMLGLSIPAWYVLFRTVFGLRKREGLAVCLLYTLVGLPLWFAAYGYGPQMCSLIALPLGVASAAYAAEQGGLRRHLLAGVTIAAGLVSFYRGIGLQYVLILGPVIVTETLRHRSGQPLVRMVAVGAVALLAGLPSHWDAAQWYFLQGAITNARMMDLSGGWGIEQFQPPSVMLGLEAFSFVRDLDDKGPLTLLDPGIGHLVTPVTWALLLLAGVGLLHAWRRRSTVVAVVLGCAATLMLNRFVLHFPYGYLKLMPVAAPLAFGLAALGAGELRQALRRLGDGVVRLTILVLAGIFSLALLCLAFNSYEAVWFNAKGWGQSIPAELPWSLHTLGNSLPSGAKVFISGRFEYPVPEDRVQTGQHMLAMRTPTEQRTVWAQRARTIAVTELVRQDIYGWFQDRLALRSFHRLLNDEEYDYYLLGPDNDPRLEGLDPLDQVWSGAGLVLYKSQGAVRATPWAIMRQRGSLAITPTNPLRALVTTGGIDPTGAGGPPGQSPSTGRLRIGILALNHTEASIRSGEAAYKVVLEPGITWFTTPNVPLPSLVAVEPFDAAPLGVVSLRLLGPGSGEQVLVPESVIRDDVYASSTVLRLKDWFGDPFRGKGPGSL
jgi:hypothetical protein